MTLPVRMAGRGRGSTGASAQAVMETLMGVRSVAPRTPNAGGGSSRGRGRTRGGGGGNRRPRDRPRMSAGRGSSRLSVDSALGTRTGSGRERIRRGARDAAWLADDVRELATEALRVAAADAADAALHRACAMRGAGAPFAGADFSALLREVPETHWAAPYLKEVASTLETNPDIPVAQKYSVLNDTIRVLSSAATPDAAMGQTDEAADPRFADAEEEGATSAVA